MTVPPSCHPTPCPDILQNGAQVNAADLWQFTPMHEAASKGRREVCTLLLCHGADPYLPNCHSKTAFDLAPEDMQETIDSKGQWALCMYIS